MNKFIVTETQKRVYAVMAHTHDEAQNCITEPEYFAEQGIYATLIDVRNEMESEVVEVSMKLKKG